MGNLKCMLHALCHSYIVVSAVKKRQIRCLFLFLCHIKYIFQEENKSLNCYFWLLQQYIFEYVPQKLEKKHIYTFSPLAKS